MKKLTILILSSALFVVAGCSRSDKPDQTVQAQRTPDAQKMKADSERLQEATANAAKQREKDRQNVNPSATPAFSPKADLSPRRVPVEPANPTP
ncbi:MAG TPA: hypothetical protein VF511_00890 [Chthoniobacterales bacterium]|jgi:outer membrane murein-binding lipoprotein Lpp